VPDIDSNYYLDREGLRTLINEFESNVIAEEYSSSATYALDSYCIHDNKLYRCTTAISTVESWNPAHWTVVTIGDDLSNKVSKTGDTMTGPLYFNTPQSGVMYNGLRISGASVNNGDYGTNRLYLTSTIDSLNATGEVWVSSDYSYYSNHPHLSSASLHAQGRSQYPDALLGTYYDESSYPAVFILGSVKPNSSTGGSFKYNGTTFSIDGNLTTTGTLNGHTLEADVPSNAVFTDTTYTGTGLISINASNVISTTAEVNQNAFSNIKVDSTTIAADTTTSTLELIAGSNVTLTPDATNDTVTIAATDTTYSDATTSASGLMSAADKTKLNGIATGAEVNVQADWNESSSSSDAYIKNKPTIPAAQVNSDWDAVSGVAQILNKPTLGTAAAKDFTTSVTSGSSDLVTSGAVYTAIDNLPEPMVFKGTLGTGGTITTLPAASDANEGYTYKVITAGTYASQAAKVGDVFVSNGTEWVIIPAGDTDSDTWRNIKVNDTELLGTAISTGAVNFKNGNNVTITGSGNDITIAATDTNTTYTFANGTNGFTVTPSGGTAQTITSYESKTAASGGTDVSLCTTGEKYTWNNKSDKFVILSYGSSTWQDFIDAYTNNKVVYCRASSAADPSSGSQTRLAFMAYVNDASSPTQVEFQYLRSLNNHTESNQMDEVYVYLLKNNNTWSPTTRKVSPKIIAGTNMTSTFVTGVTPTITLDATDTTYSLGTSGNTITLTPSSGTAQSITAPYATNAGKLDYSDTDNTSLVSGTSTNLEMAITNISDPDLDLYSGVTINNDPQQEPSITLKSSLTNQYYSQIEMTDSSMELTLHRGSNLARILLQEATYVSTTVREVILTADEFKISAPLSSNGNYNMAKSMPQILLNNADIDWTTANNVTAQSVTGLWCRAKDRGNSTSIFETIADTNGDIRTRIVAQNCDISKTITGANYLDLKVTKAGTQSVSVSAPSAWRTALSAQEDLEGNALTSGTDLNNLTTNKNYWVPNSGITNVPVASRYGYLEVIRTGGGSYMQRFTIYGNNSATDRGTTWIRFYINSQWYDWVKIAVPIT